MFMAGILLFSSAVTIASYLISRSRDLDPGKVAATTTLIAWGSMMAGLALSRAAQ